MKEHVITYNNQKGIPKNGRKWSSACVIIDADTQGEAAKQFQVEYKGHPIIRIQTVR